MLNLSINTDPNANGLFDNYTDGMFDEQIDAFHSLFKFFDENKQQFALKRFRAAGGTGKTFTIKRVIRALQDHRAMKIAVVSFTGRAAMQISDRWVHGITVHSLMYSPILDDEKNLVGWRKKPTTEILNEYDAIVVEEASMLPSNIFFDLVDLGLPILIMGDGEQLPAIDKAIADFNLMVDAPVSDVTKLITHPDTELKINRRTDQSLQGIVKLTATLREQNAIPRFLKGDGLKLIKKSVILTKPFHEENQYDIIICGMNKTRTKINELVRAARGFHDVRPSVGETIICLRNDVVNGQSIYNGEFFTIQARRDGYNFGHYLVATRDGNIIDLKIHDRTWTSEKGIKDEDDFKVFTYGYAISCHKSQGGTFDNVLFYDEDVSFFLDQRRFRYTACSRAAKSLTVGL